MLRPSRYGLDARYDSLRPGQEQALWLALRPGPRCDGLGAPTGFGKSLIPPLASAVSGLRVLTLTATKILQDQYTDPDKGFGDLITDIRGQSNYKCNHDPMTRLSGVTVDEGPCHLGTHCDLKDDGCSYFDQQRLFMGADIGITNYTYWIYANMFGEGLGIWDIMFLDEAHQAPQELADALSIRLNDRLVSFAHLDEWPLDDDPDVWAYWFRGQVVRLKREIATAKLELKSGGSTPALLRKLKRYRRLVNNLALGMTIDDSWILERGPNWIQWEPIWAAPYAEQYLFRYVKKIVPMSACLNAKIPGLLGLDKEDCHVTEFDSSFPLDRRLITWIPTCDVDARSWSRNRGTWVNRLDEIVGPRYDRRGLIHTVSYERAQEYVRLSRYRDRLLCHDSRSAASVITYFKRSRPGTVLVTPSAETGVDFPGEECRYIVLAKIPFGDPRSPITAARLKADPEWGDWSAATRTQQALGRGNRFVGDWCENFIIDNHWRWFRKQASRHFSFYFKQAWRTSYQVPPPPALSWGY